MRFLNNAGLLLSSIVIFGVLIIGMRLSDIYTVTTSGTLFAHTALAEGKTAETKVAEATPPAAEAKTPPAAETAAEPPSDEDKSPAEIEVLKQLSERRDQLEKRNRDLDTREALIKVAEQRVDQKIKEMDTLRLQLQSMVNQASEAQAAQLENLVKIYETMKPKEAARIFETLDMSVLLGVIQRMKPARTAPIMAEMAPEKAKELTIALTKQDQLPKVK